MGSGHKKKGVKIMDDQNRAYRASGVQILLERLVVLLVVLLGHFQFRPQLDFATCLP